MNRSQALFLLESKAVLDVLAEESLPLGGIPESHIYMGLGMDYDRSVGVISFLRDKKAIKVSRHLVSKGADFDKIHSLLCEFESKVKQ